VTKMSPARRDGSEEGPGREEEGRSARAQRGTIGWVSLAMINLAINKGTSLNTKITQPSR